MTKAKQNLRRICFLTCEDLINHPDGYMARDDDFAVSELQSRGFEVDTVPWTLFDFKIAYDAVIVRTTWDYVQNHEAFLKQLRKIRDRGYRLFNDYSIIEWNIHKSYLLDLESKGIAIPPTRMLKAGADVDDVYAQVSAWKVQAWIAKPAISATSYGLVKLSREDLKEGLKEIARLGRDYLIQPFQPEILEGEISLCFFNKRYSHAVIKTAKSGDFRIQEAYGGKSRAFTPTAQQIAFGDKVMQSIPDPLFFARVDFLQTANGPVLMELELIEPSLFFGTDAHAPGHFADVCMSAMQQP